MPGWRHHTATCRHHKARRRKDILQRPANAKRGPVTLLPVGLLHQRLPQPLHHCRAEARCLARCCCARRQDEEREARAKEAQDNGVKPSSASEKLRPRRRTWRSLQSGTRASRA